MESIYSWVHKIKYWVKFWITVFNKSSVPMLNSIGIKLT
jgi:hypothetical protein